MPPKKPRKTTPPHAQAAVPVEPAGHDPAAHALDAVTGAAAAAAAAAAERVSPSRKKSRATGSCASGGSAQATSEADMQQPPSPSLLASNLLGESGFVFEELNRGLLGRTACNALVLHRRQQQQDRNSCAKNKTEQQCTGLCSSLSPPSLLPLKQLLCITRRPVRTNLFPQYCFVTFCAGVRSRVRGGGAHIPLFDMRWQVTYDVWRVTCDV
jgi:hypothetical protein